LTNDYNVLYLNLEGLNTPMLPVARDCFKFPFSCHYWNM